MILSICCTKKDVQLEEDLSPRFEKAMKFFHKEKYTRAKNEFEYC